MPQPPKKSANRRRCNSEDEALSELVRQILKTLKSIESANKALPGIIGQILKDTQQILKGQSTMALDLTGLTAAVAKETTTTDSVLALVTTLAAVQDPAELAALVAQMGANADRVAAAVVANTPAPPAV